MRTLYARLVLSHVASVLLITPLIGIALIYLIETQVVYPNLSRNLVVQGKLLAELSKRDPNFWMGAESARALAGSDVIPSDEQVMFLRPDGLLVATNVPLDAAQPEQSLDSASLKSVANGQPIERRAYDNRGMHAEVAEVLIPVEGADQRVAGVIRLTHRMNNVMDMVLRTRYIIASVLFFALLLQVLIGWGLAATLQRPLRRVTQAVNALRLGAPLEPLPEQGPAEIRLLVRGVNYLVEHLSLLDQMRKEMRANLVHELRRPLGALRSSTYALLNGADRDEALRTELLTGMDRELEGMEQLLQDLARLHELLVGTLDLKLTPINLSTWLPVVLAPWREAAESHSLHWEEKLAPGFALTRVDPARMGRAVENLVSNAIKYTPAGGTITIAGGCEGQMAWIRVSDTGRGIPLEEQSLVFNPYYQGEKSMVGAGGMGLGLTIARDIIAAHGGQLDLESTPGLGSHFTIRLAVADPAAALGV